MRVGVPREIKPAEYRVAITPAGVREMVEHGHEVLVEAGAGEVRGTQQRTVVVHLVGGGHQPVAPVHELHEPVAELETSQLVVLPGRRPVVREAWRQ